MPDEPITPTREMRVSNPMSDTNPVPDIVIGPESVNRNLTRYTEKTILADRWEVQEFLGEGGMSAVYKTKHLAMGRFAAAKILHSHLSVNDKHLQRFQREAQAASALSHPNVISVYDCGVTPDGRPFILMEYLQGKSLADEVRDKGAMPLERALEIFLAVCDGMAHAHEKGIVHRDLKPSNVMLIIDADKNEQAKIVDFGIARMIPREGAEGEAMHQLTQTGEVFGSPLYMSPEQCLGKNLDQRSDIYAMGCLMYEVLAGYPPLKGESFLETLHMQLEQVPKPYLKGGLSNSKARMVEGVVLKCLAKDPVERYGSMRELRRDLASAAGDHAWFNIWRTQAGRELFTRFRSEKKEELAKLNLIAVVAAIVFPASLLLFWAANISWQFDQVPTGINQMHNNYWPRPYLKKVPPRLSTDTEKGGLSIVGIKQARLEYEKEPITGAEAYTALLHKGSMELMANGEYSKAIGYLNTLLPLRLRQYGEADSEIWLIRLATAKCLYFLGKYEEAARMYALSFTVPFESPLLKDKDEYMEGFGIYGEILMQADSPDFEKIAYINDLAAKWALSSAKIAINTRPDIGAYLHFANLRADALRMLGDPSKPSEKTLVARMNEITAADEDYEDRTRGRGDEHIGSLKRNSPILWPTHKLYKDIKAQMEGASDLQQVMYCWGKGCLYQKFEVNQALHCHKRALAHVSGAQFDGSKEIEAQIRKDLVLLEEKSNPIAAVFEKYKVVQLWNDRTK